MKAAKNQTNTPAQQEPISACKLYRDMLMKSAETREVTHHTGFGITISARPGFILLDNATSTSYDKSISDLTRAKFACEQGLVVHPSSTSGDRFFTTAKALETDATEIQSAQVNGKTY